MVNNKIYSELLELKIINNDSVVLFHPETRDEKKIPVMRCEKSGVIFLKNDTHISDEYYTNMDSFEYWETKNRKKSLITTYNDDLRRVTMIKKYIKNKKFLDFGCGNGGVLELSKKYTNQVYGLELQTNIRNSLINNGLKIFSNIDEIITRKEKFDVISLFHVFEHLSQPLETLHKLYDCLNKNGTLIIEVPNANDALISYYNCEEFKKFTLWSEHLILHTKESLETYLRNSNFKKNKIFGVQRYPISNHLYWLSHGEPKGQFFFKSLNDNKINKRYTKILEENNLTDTIISISKK